jgi:hypothetical protein
MGLIPDPAASRIDPQAVVSQLDFVAVHVYPRTGQQAQSIDLVRRLAALGKPVLVEETYLLAADAPTLEAFILGTRPYAAGWLGFYFGRTPSQLAGSQTFQGQIQRGWLELFQKNAPTLARTPLS